MSSESSILIVDDNKGMRETLRMVLGPDYRFGFAEDFPQAEAAISSEPYDLVLLDLRLPSGNGMDLVPQIRQKAPGTEVIIVTAAGDYYATLEAFRQRVAGFIEKDFAPADLRDLVRETLESRRRKTMLEQICASIGPDGAVLQDEVRACFPRREPRPGERPELGSPTAFFRMLADVLESQDVMTKGHSLRVCRHALALGRVMGLADREIAELETAGYLHDIGKVGVNKTVLNRKGQLSQLDREVIERHTVLGSELVRPLGLPSLVADGVRHHHERLDGSGYPDRLAGEDCLLYSRIIAVVDSFDAMTWPRIYRPNPCPAARAVDILCGEVHWYDKEVLRAFREAYQRGVLGTDLADDPLFQRTRATAEMRAHGKSEEDLACGEPQEACASSLGAAGGLMGEGLPGRQHRKPPSWQDRLCYQPLGDLYADPSARSPVTVPVVRYPDSGVSFLDPDTLIEVSMVPAGRERFSALIRRHDLEPLYRVPGSLHVCEPPKEKQVAGYALEEFTDGQHVFAVELTQTSRSAPIRYRLLGRGRVRLTPRRIVFPEEAGVQHMDLDLAAHVRDQLSRLGEWLVTQDASRTTARCLELLSGRQGPARASWIKVPLTDSLFAARGRAEPIGFSASHATRDALDAAAAAGASASVLLAPQADLDDGQGTLTQVAMDVSLKSIPVMDLEMDRVLQDICKQVYSEPPTVGMIHADDADVRAPWAAARCSRLQSQLLRFGQSFHAALLGARATAIQSAMKGTLGLAQQRGRACMEFTLRDLPLLTGEAQRAVEPLFLVGPRRVIPAECSFDLSFLLLSCLLSEPEELDGKRRALEALHTICRVCGAEQLSEYVESVELLWTRSAATQLPAQVWPLAHGALDMMAAALHDHPVQSEGMTLGSLATRLYGKEPPTAAQTPMNRWSGLVLSALAPGATARVVLSRLVPQIVQADAETRAAASGHLVALLGDHQGAPLMSMPKDARTAGLLLRTCQAALTLDVLLTHGPDPAAHSSDRLRIDSVHRYLPFAQHSLPSHPCTSQSYRTAKPVSSERIVVVEHEPGAELRTPPSVGLQAGAMPQPWQMSKTPAGPAPQRRPGLYTGLQDDPGGLRQDPWSDDPLAGSGSRAFWEIAMDTVEEWAVVRGGSLWPELHIKLEGCDRARVKWMGRTPFEQVVERGEGGMTFPGEDPTSLAHRVQVTFSEG